MINVDPHSPQGVYDTLLELRLQDWAHEEDPAVSSSHTSLILTHCDAIKTINVEHRMLCLQHILFYIYINISIIYIFFFMVYYI